jgi:hypothetical protein
MGMRNRTTFGGYERSGFSVLKRSLASELIASSRRALPLLVNEPGKMIDEKVVAEVSRVFIASGNLEQDGIGRTLRITIGAK